MTRPPEVQRFMRRLTTARRELRKAVERTMAAEHTGVEFRRGHYAEMCRQAREIRSATDELIALLDKKR